AAGDGAGDEERAGLDAIGNDGVGGAMKKFDALDAEGGSAHTLDFGAHFNQEFGETGDFGFERAICEDRFAFGQDRGAEDIFSAGDRDFREAEGIATQAAGAGLDVAMLDGNFGAELFQGLDVNVDGAGADGAAARKRDA